MLILGKLNLICSFVGYFKLYIYCIVFLRLKYSNVNAKNIMNK